ncbi:MAG: hypothetical protein KIS62_07655 [Ramlibacter sp.]|nr:hypothetical protein [Ramlibacter sp.]
MSLLSSPRFLQRVLWVDAASCVAVGVPQVGLSAELAAWLHLPAALLMGTGVFLLAYAAAVLWIAARDPLPRRLVGVIVAGNLAWAVGCVALLAAGGLSPTWLGVAWVMAQALTVLVLAEVQWFALRKVVIQPAW